MQIHSAQNVGKVQELVQDLVQDQVQEQDLVQDLVQDQVQDQVQDLVQDQVMDLGQVQDLAQAGQVQEQEPDIFESKSWNLI